MENEVTSSPGTLLPSLRGGAATIGFFDGVHLGHRFLIGEVMKMAEAEGLESMAITFDRHPRQVLQSDWQPQLLTTLQQKVRLLRQTGIGRVEVLHFTRELAALSAREFMDKVLRRQLGVKKLVVGYDHRFGHNRAEGFEDYVRYGRELGIEVVQSREVKLQFQSAAAHSNDGTAAAVQHISSSAVRRLLGEGNVSLAATLLDRHHIIMGHVAHGFGEGRKIGFPTANLDTTGWPLLVPAHGVYAVAVKIFDTNEAMAATGDARPVTMSLDDLNPPLAPGWHPAMLNIGHRPTFGGTATTIEAHILRFAGDIYGRPMAVAFFARIRDEHKFDSINALEEQLRKDRAAVEQTFALYGWH